MMYDPTVTVLHIHIPRRGKCSCSHKKIQSIFIFNSSQLETIQMFISLRMVKYFAIYSFNGINEKEELLVHITTRINFSDIMLSEGKQKKYYMLSDSFSLKFIKK